MRFFCYILTGNIYNTVRLKLYIFAHRITRHVVHHITHLLIARIPEILEEDFPVGSVISDPEGCILVVSC